MVGNNRRKLRVTPTPAPFCYVSTFFLVKWEEDVVYASCVQALKMFRIGAFEDFLWPIFVSASWNYHISKAMLFLHSSPLYYQKYRIIHFLWRGEAGCWVLNHTHSSDALGYSVKIPIKRPLIYMRFCLQRAFGHSVSVRAQPRASSCLASVFISTVRRYT